jgi:hypothetical protein
MDAVFMLLCFHILILEKQRGELRTGSIWPRIGTSVGLFEYGNIPSGSTGCSRETGDYKTTAPTTTNLNTVFT